MPISHDIGLSEDNKMDLTLNLIKKPIEYNTWHTSQDLIKLKEFAKLVALECSTIADKAEPYKASDLMKKHFGV